MFSLEKQTILVTGALGHLGLGMTRAILGAGGSVIALSRNQQKKVLADQLAAEFGRDRVRFAVLDLSDSAAVASFLRSLDGLNTLTGLVNNALEIAPATGFDLSKASLEGMDEETFLNGLATGLGWPFNLTRWAAPHFARLGGGSIVNISSMYGLVAPDAKVYEGTEFFSPPNYGCAKAGLLALTRFTAVAYGRKGVRCNAICPGPFPKATLDDATFVAKGGETFLKRLADKTALGRIGSPEDLGGVVVFLLSRAAAYMTGQTLSVDGGWTIT